MQAVGPCCDAFCEQQQQSLQQQGLDNQPHQVAQGREVITVDDDEDDTSSETGSETPRVPTSRRRSASDPRKPSNVHSSSSSSSNSSTSSSSSSGSSSGSGAPAGGVERSSDALAHVPSGLPRGSPSDVSAFAEALAESSAVTHYKTLWVQGRLRPEQLEKHLLDIRTKPAIGKVSLRGPVFPSACEAAAFMRAVSKEPRITSLTLSAPEMPEDQFAAICEGLVLCSSLNHVDCNAIGNKPLKPAALQLLLQRLQLLPDLREVNLSGNEFTSPRLEAPGGFFFDGIHLLKGLLQRGVLCLLARECGLRQLAPFLLWVLNRCHCLRLRQLDLGASSKLLTRLVPGETFDEEVRN